jgi:hypothetical protein
VDEPVYLCGRLVYRQTATVEIDVVHGELDSFAPLDAAVGECQHQDAALVIRYSSREPEDLLVG